MGPGGIGKETDLSRRGGGNYAAAMSGLVGGGGAGGTVSRFPPDEPDRESAARAYLVACGLKPKPDAVAQLNEVFLPCLEIICERPWNPDGSTWRTSGWLGIMTDVRKKFERLWERGWKHGERHDDSILDLINYLGFLRRSGPSRWNHWGEPYSGPEDRP